MPRVPSRHGALAPVVIFHELDDATFSSAHVRAMLVAGSGFLVDSYDNFVIGLMVPMVSYHYYNKPTLPSSLIDGWVKAASSWGNMFGQIGFAVLGDTLGRKRVYGYELVILIVGALLCSFAVWPVHDNPDNALYLLAAFRFILGVGVGGDYPVSAVITSEFACSKRRGQYIAAVFAMQGIGILLAASMAILVLAVFRDQILVDGPSAVGYCWRILAGFGTIPALISVYFRFQIPETPRFTANVLGDEEGARRNAREFLGHRDLDNVLEVKNTNIPLSYRRAFTSYFSVWANVKVLIGCAACWFFLDIGYYGTSLNTSVILEIIGYGTSTITSKGNQRVFDDLWHRATGTAIINLAGTVPGYWFTVLLVDSWGRKPIQNMGFIVLTVLFLCMAIFLDDLKTHYTSVFFAMYAACQFFFNFGPNSTTFILPAELFPTAIRATGHGISAASGKAGAIIAAQAFAVLAKSSFVWPACCQTLEELSGEATSEFYHRGFYSRAGDMFEAVKSPVHIPGSSLMSSKSSHVVPTTITTTLGPPSSVSSNHSSQHSGSTARQQQPRRPAQPGISGHPQPRTPTSARRPMSNRGNNAVEGGARFVTGRNC